jgi:Family of unknown function (DUF5681)
VTSTVPKPDDYEVGYKKPPKATQFANGQSGNPGGRPPRAKNTAELFNKVFDEKISINENGRPRALTKREIAFKQLANRAAKGDYKAIETMLKRFSALMKIADRDGDRSVSKPRINVIVDATEDHQPGDDNPELARLLLEAQGEAYLKYGEERRKKYNQGAPYSSAGNAEDPWDNMAEEAA